MNFTTKQWNELRRLAREYRARRRILAQNAARSGATDDQRESFLMAAIAIAELVSVED